MNIDYALIWAALIAVAVITYVMLDGFDLGVGILFPFIKDPEHRDRMINSIAPVWDGNETWLVLGGGGLLAVFPLAYSIIMPALYAPIIIMLLALVFRGVAFEFRWKSPSHKPYWDFAFWFGSIIATFAQGMALGGLVHGIPVNGRHYAGGWWDWLSPFSLMTGVALVIGYTLLGSTWLVLKTEGALQERVRHLSRVFGGLMLVMIAVASLWTPFLSDQFRAKWLAWPAMLFVAPVPLLVLVCAFLLFRGLARKNELTPYLAVNGLFLLCYIGLLISFFPYIVPSSVTLWDAAGPDKSLAFILPGALVIIPLILGYTGYAYWVFRGKVRHSSAYN